jgi:hypothetical protein
MPLAKGDYFLKSIYKEKVSPICTNSNHACLRRMRLALKAATQSSLLKARDSQTVTPSRAGGPRTSKEGNEGDDIFLFFVKELI